MGGLHRVKPKPVQADGNCQFRALSKQMYGDEDHHGDLRVRVVKQLEAAPQRYENFVYEPFVDYVNRMACDGEWGDNVTLQAASDALGTDIHILTDVTGGEHIVVYPMYKLSSTFKTPLYL